ncbi:MAG TPA: pyridoxamine 5'-phosphate oxidase family protein [Nitrososphaeraceae archaeon]
MEPEVFFCKELLLGNSEQPTRMKVRIVPIWFTLDDEDNIIFNTGGKSIKTQNIRRDNRVRLCVDDLIPLYSFVTVDDIAEISQLKFLNGLKS